MQFKTILLSPDYHAHYLKSYKTKLW